MAQILSCCGCGVGLAALAPIHLLAWELPYVMGVALKDKDKKKKPLVNNTWVKEELLGKIFKYSVSGVPEL